MKTYKHLWEKLITKENFRAAFLAAKKGKTKRRDVKEFCKNIKENLESIRQLVASGRFHTSNYRSKKIFEPKERMVYMLPFAPDRIVQHAIINVLKPILLNLFIENTYASIEGRGQLKASIKCSQYARKYKYCLKCDIRKFYPSIVQKILSDKFHRIIKDEKFMALLDDIIFSFPGETNCPIGNYTSQWFGNFYLTFLDNFVLHELKCEAYLRYCDDFLLFSNDKSYLNYCREKIADFLWTELRLEYSKADLFKTKQGVDFCGYRCFGKFVLVRKSTVKRIKKRVYRIKTGVELDLQKAQSQLASDNGILKHACTYHLKKSLDFDNLKTEIKTKIMKGGTKCLK